MEAQRRAVAVGALTWVGEATQGLGEAKHRSQALLTPKARRPSHRNRPGGP